MVLLMHHEAPGKVKNMMQQATPLFHVMRRCERHAATTSLKRR
jgi:hypothetical protein